MLPLSTHPPLFSLVNTFNMPTYEIQLLLQSGSLPEYEQYLGVFLYNICDRKSDQLFNYFNYNNINTLYVYSRLLSV